MIKISPVAFALLAATSGFAAAADLPVSYEPQIDLRGSIEPTTNRWQGFYTGGQFGYGWFRGQDNLGNPGTNLSDVVGGLHAGYNHTFGQFLIGIEAEGNLSAIEGRTSVGLDAEINWMLAGRARAGFIFDQFLAYATTGVSLAEASLKGNKESTNTHTGLVVGGGLEAFVTESLTARIEYQHHWFDEQTYNTNTIDYKVDGQMDIVRAGLSYHF
ncbi:outer membrane protein [Roseibium sediminis]|uniref:outer membrane protein n=1 Tax=Roseibium sediminis TaxID=1775174 RepID=UPI00123CA2C7|nr:outer membrane beta-barrel protein [Roseibium sediminis]